MLPPPPQPVNARPNPRRAEHLGQTNLMLFATPAAQNLTEGSRERSRCVVALGIQVSTASRRCRRKLQPGGLTKAERDQLHLNAKQAEGKASLYEGHGFSCSMLQLPFFRVQVPSVQIPQLSTVAITGDGAGDPSVDCPVVKILEGWCKPGPIRQEGEQIYRL